MPTARRSYDIAIFQGDWVGRESNPPHVLHDDLDFELNVPYHDAETDRVLALCSYLRGCDCKAVIRGTKVQYRQ
jgi:hypothetical protein